MSQSVTDWVDFNQKNKPQGNAVSGAVMLVLASGLHIGFIFNKDLQDFPWARGHSSMEIILTYAMFYIAGCAGLYLAAMTVNRLTKKNIYVRSISSRVA